MEIMIISRLIPACCSCWVSRHTVAWHPGSRCPPWESEGYQFWALPGMVMVMISSCESSIYIAWHDDDDDDTLHGMMMTKTKVEMALNHRSPLILLLQGHEVILGNLADLGQKPDVTIKQIGIQDSVWAFQTALISVHLRCFFWKKNQIYLWLHMWYLEKALLTMFCQFLSRQTFYQHFKGWVVWLWHQWSIWSV